MTTASKKLSERYLAALRAYLTESPESSLEPAAAVGREALGMDLEIPDLTLIHEEALVALASPEHSFGDGKETLERGGRFFREALVPLLEAADSARQAAPQAKQTEAPAPGTDLSAVTKRLQRENAKRKDAESALNEKRRQYDRLLAESKVMQKELQHLSHQILWAQEEERKKISRELHDEISQILTGINVRLAALRIESMANAEAISKKIVGAQRLVEKSVATVHRFARELRPVMLDDLGLIPALTVHLKEVRKRTGLQIHLTTPKDATVETVDTLKRTVLFRIAQEALANVEKHAQASLVNVSVQVEPDHISLEVSDNGKSFPVQGVLANRRRRLGLIGMRERAEMVGGKFDIESKPGEGTTVCVRIPLHNGTGSEK